MSALHIKGVPTETRDSLRPILDQSFKGIYRWHAQRTLRSVKWVREATQGDTQVGLTMFTMLEQSSGYIYYIAVTPSQRAKASEVFSSTMPFSYFGLQERSRSLHVSGLTISHQSDSCSRETS